MIVALGVANPLDDVLLRRLGRDAPELLLGQLGEQLVADLRLGVERRLRVLQGDLVRRIGDLVDDRLDLEQLDLTDVGIELGLDLMLEAERPPGRGEHGFFERRDDDALVDPFLFAHLLDDAIQIGLHVVSFRLPRACPVCRTLRAATVRTTLPERREFVLVVGPRDRIEGDLVRGPVVAGDRDAIGPYGGKDAAERMPRADALRAFARAPACRRTEENDSDASGVD